MANLKLEEFNKIIEFLAEDHGLQRFRDKLVRLNGLVTRRRAGKVSALASQLYTLTGGLRREVPATVAIHSLWAEQVGERLGEEGEEELEKLAEKINECLGDRDCIIEGKEEEIDGHLRAYEAHLAAALGAERARLDMILKAVPDVAEKLRAAPLAKAEAGAKAETAPQAGEGADSPE